MVAKRGKRGSVGKKAEAAGTEQEEMQNEGADVSGDMGEESVDNQDETLKSDGANSELNTSQNENHEVENKTEDEGKMEESIEGGSDKKEESGEKTEETFPEKKERMAPLLESPPSRTPVKMLPPMDMENMRGNSFLLTYGYMTRLLHYSQVHMIQRGLSWTWLTGNTHTITT